MPIFLAIIVVAIRFLIAIGDSILLAFQKTFLFIKALARKVKRQQVLQRLLEKAKKSKYSVAFRISRPITKKVKKTRPVVIFPIPFLVKFRYFLAGCLFSFLILFIPLLVFVFIQDLPSPKSLANAQYPQTTKIYDRNNTLLYQIYAQQNRTLVPLSEIPIHFQQATIAIEDKDFYNHPGFDLSAIIRSVKENASGKTLQGGSTITQQLIKSTLLTPETSVQRKIKEVILAFWAERIYSKKEILHMYFNQIPYGGTAWGIQAAAQVYFGKDAKDLTLAQSAFLAGIPQAPTLYSPYGTSPTLWKKRQGEVLDRMVLLGYIKKPDAQKAKEEELSFLVPQNPLRAGHFVLYVKDWLVKKYGLPAVERGGLTVRTSIDLKTQAMAEQIVSEEVANNSYLNLSNGAALVTNPKNGDILAMVGSKDFDEPIYGNFNITTAPRQPGSSIKVVTYSQALSSGFTAATILDDSPITYAAAGGPSYSPVNYDGRFHGRVPLRLALANSFNIPAVKTLNQIGVPGMVGMAKQMGITNWNEPSNYGLAITLGAAEVKMVDMAVAYGVFANEGVRINLNPILKVTDYKGDILEEKKTFVGKRVLSEAVAFIMSSILSDDSARSAAFGPNSTLNIPGKTVSVKTGTTDSKRDNWTFGYTPSYLVAVWVGNNDNTPMSPTLASGITGAAPIWNKIMTNLLKDIPDEKPRVPSSIVTKTCFGRTEYFVKGTENAVNCSRFPLPSPSPTP